MSICVVALDTSNLLPPQAIGGKAVKSEMPQRVNHCCKMYLRIRKISLNERKTKSTRKRPVEVDTYAVLWQLLWLEWLPWPSVTEVETGLVSLSVLS